MVGAHGVGSNSHSPLTMEGVKQHGDFKVQSDRLSTPFISFLPETPKK